ncbi:hypothetical protein ACP70R_020874 [Stipagrostis hirtigluma subsp. patula]
MEGGRSAGESPSWFIPMDHDDTDFQSQNFHLAGEDNSKFPLGLRPFALPKLDIEDQLQGHLRFDNLIDSEVFFSVQGHSSSWIEVLSTGSSVVDFSSSAAESCSISKTNNVWSEATSMESVEMLLKSVGENEMAGNMDVSAPRQLSGMDDQIDLSNMQPKSSSPATGSTVVPTENDQSQSTHSRMAGSPSRAEPQLEHFAPFSMDEEAEHAAGSVLSDRKSSLVLEPVAEERIASEKLSSASNNTSESCPAAENYFEAVHGDHSLEKLNVTSAEVDSGKLNSEPFPELAPLQNIYVTDSYHFEQDNQESDVGITSQDSKVCHVDEHKVHGGLHELHNLTCTGQPLSAVNLSSQAGNETLLPESSDGLLEAITNPVTMLQRNDDMTKRVGTLQPSFSQVQHAEEGSKSSVDRSNKLGVKEFTAGEESGSAPSHQSEPDSRNSSPHLITSLSTESSKLIQSPERKLAHATDVPEETKSARVDSTNISRGDESKVGMSEHHQDSVDNLKVGAMEEKTITEEIPEVSANIEKMVESGHEENTTGSTGTSKDKIDASGSIAHGNYSAGFLDDKEPNISSVNHEEPKECDSPALEQEPENQHLVLPTSAPQEKMPAQSISSSSAIISTTVTGSFVTPKDKSDCSGGFLPDDSSAALLEGKDLGMPAINHEGSSKEESKSAVEDGDQTIISPGTGKFSAVSVDSNIDAVCSSANAVTEKAEYKELATLGGLTTGETKDKSGHNPDTGSQTFQTDKPSIQSEHHKDLVTPPTSDVVSNNGTDHTSGTVSSQGNLGSFLLESENDDRGCTDAPCGSPTVISCTDPSPLEGEPGSNASLQQRVDEQSEDPKDPEGLADATQSLKECSTRNVKPTVSSEETNAAGDDRSFSFEVGAPPNLSEKAHSPAWNPFPSYNAAQSQSIKITTENPQPENPSGSSLKKTSDDSNSKEKSSERKVTESAGRTSVNSHIGDSTKTTNSPVEEPRPPTTPECSDFVNLPFTDAQHVQLRAQIFVYGALIQGIPPLEVYMAAAFGETAGGGKSTWDAAWRAAYDRFQTQKPFFTGLETPTSSHIGSGVPEKHSKGTSVKTAPASKKGGKSVLPAHSAVPLHSPTFNVPVASSPFNMQRGTHLDFSQAISPAFTYNSHMRQPISGAASWYPQSPGARPAPWLRPPQNLIFDSSTQAAVPTETAKGASSKNMSISHSVSPGIFLPGQASSIVSPPSAVIHEGKQKTPPSTSKHGTASQKPRKRKKASASPEQQPVIAAPQLKTDMASFTPVAKHTAGFTLSTHFPSTTLGSSLVPNTSQITSTPNYQITGGVDSGQRIIFSEQIRGAIEQSIGQAKGAALDSIEAVRHKEGIWSHLSTISRNTMPAGVEEKLTSAAAAAEAAVSVAKAAAEAAKMASEAALQAKMMAEEALGSSISVKAAEFDGNGNPSSLPSSTPASSWKVKDNSHGAGSVISVAREAARKRVEEASAAAKRAENLDAILKAAELAAEAVFKAGTIIGMGEPLPFTLSELLESGPDGYWKSEQVRNKKAGTGNDNPVTEILEVPAVSKSGRKRGRKPKSDQAIQNLEPSSSGKELQPDGMQSGHGVEDVPSTAPLNGNGNDTASVGMTWNGIEKGSTVEVLSDDGGFGVAWFAATVVDINEDSAFVSYDSRSEGTGPRKEWVPLKQEGDKAPRLRLAHPATLSKFKTRKRRRETAGNCSWSVGDHIDAWVKDSWREGVITQNHEADGTKFVVQCSAAGGAGDSLVVDAWNLRPTLVWKDGQWTEWSQATERKSKSNKGDSPLEKRRRTGPLQAVGDPPIGSEAGGPSKDTSTDNGKKPEEVMPLALSQRDMVFNIGKSVVENKTDALAFKRPGLQKEGSKVVYGVPKHGKKKKFMEVSKHYVADRAEKISEGNASSRFAKHLVPPLPRPRENTSKVDHRGRRVGEIRPRGLKPSKPQTVSANSALPLSAPSSGVSERSFAFAGSMTSTSNTEKPTVEKNNSALGTVLRTEVPSVSEIQAAPTVPISKQNVTTTNRAKRRYVPTVDNLNRSTLKTSEKTISSDSAEPRRTNSDSAEPRRSNRRIQPTSRLLEGLQSSLIISKVPGEKGPRSHSRNAASRELMAEKDERCYNKAVVVRQLSVLYINVACLLRVEAWIGLEKRALLELEDSDVL